MEIKDFIKKSYFKPWDLILIILLLICSFLPYIIVTFQSTSQEETIKQAVLKVDGEIIQVFDLEKDTPAYTYKYEDPDGDYNLIEIDGDRIRITETNCGDLLCVRKGWISEPGETPIVCLPHKLTITVQSSEGSEEGSLIY